VSEPQIEYVNLTLGTCRMDVVVSDPKLDGGMRRVHYGWQVKEDRATNSPPLGWDDTVMREVADCRSRRIVDPMGMMRGGR